MSVRAVTRNWAVTSRPPGSTRRHQFPNCPYLVSEIVLEGELCRPRRTGRGFQSINRANLASTAFPRLTHLNFMISTMVCEQNYTHESKTNRKLICFVNYGIIDVCLQV